MDRNQALQILMSASGLKPGFFPPNSRYQGVDTAKLTTLDGRVIVFLRRRFIPPVEEHALLQLHTVVEGERLDVIAAKYLGDPELFWRICDANSVLRPADLTERPGLSVRISLPHGVAGPSGA